MIWHLHCFRCIMLPQVCTQDTVGRRRPHALTLELNSSLKDNISVFYFDKFSEFCKWEANHECWIHEKSRGAFRIANLYEHLQTVFCLYWIGARALWALSNSLREQAAPGPWKIVHVEMEHLHKIIQIQQLKKSLLEMLVSLQTTCT